ncbi:unnamed protein product, partial [Ectocarpus sp. 8 AP-2014]
LIIPYCISWKELGQNGDSCPDAEDPLVPGTDFECSCGEEVLAVPIIKVCPTDLPVTVAAAASPCYGDGTNFIIDIGDIPPLAVVIEFDIKDEANQDVVFGDLDGTTATGVLQPEAKYTLDVGLYYPDFRKVCETMTFDLEPTCSCEDDNTNCACDPSSDDLCTADDLICCPL